MKVELSFSYEVDDPDPEMKARATEVVDDEARALMLRIHQRFTEAGFDVERFETSKETRKEA